VLALAKPLANPLFIVKSAAVGLLLDTAASGWSFNNTVSKFLPVKGASALRVYL
jgi:hypothetical protein